MSCVATLAVQSEPVEGKESCQSRQEYKIQANKGIFTQLHCAVFVWRQEPALCQTPGTQNEGFPCFIRKPSDALRYHCAAQSREDGRGSPHRLCYYIPESTPLPLGSLLGITSLGLLLWQGCCFPIDPFKMVLGFSPRRCLLILCKDTHTGKRKGGGMGEGGMGCSGDWERGVGWDCCTLSGLKEWRQSTSTTEEKEYLSGSGIPIASPRLLFLFLSLVPSFFFPLLGPQVFLGLQKGNLGWSQMGDACSGDPFCSNMDIPL